MQTDEMQRPREASTTRRGEGTPKRGDSSDSDEEQTSVMKTYAEDEVPSSPVKDEEEAAYVSAEDTSRVSRTPSPTSTSKRSRGESPADREKSGDDNPARSEYRRHSADISDLTPPHQRSSSFAERLKSSIENAPSYLALDAAKKESLEKALAPPASAAASSSKPDLNNVVFHHRDFRLDKDGNFKAPLRRASESSRPTRVNFEPDWNALQRVILPPPRKAASDAAATLAGMNAPPQVFTVAEYGYLQFSKRLRVASEGKRMCFYIDRELDVGTYLVTNCSGNAVAYATCTLHASCTRHGAIAGSGAQLNPLDFPVYVETCATRCKPEQKAHYFCFSMPPPFQGEFRLVSTPVKKDKSVVAKIWFSVCVENFGTARTVETMKRRK